MYPPHLPAGISIIDQSLTRRTQTSASYLLRCGGVRFGHTQAVVICVFNGGHVHNVILWLVKALKICKRLISDKATKGGKQAGRHESNRNDEEQARSTGHFSRHAVLPAFTPKPIDEWEQAEGAHTPLCGCLRGCGFSNAYPGFPWPWPLGLCPTAVSPGATREEGQQGVGQGHLCQHFSSVAHSLAATAQAKPRRPVALSHKGCVCVCVNVIRSAMTSHWQPFPLLLSFKATTTQF